MQFSFLLKSKVELSKERKEQTNDSETWRHITITVWKTKRTKSIKPYYTIQYYIQYTSPPFHSIYNTLWLAVTESTLVVMKINDKGEITGNFCRLVKIFLGFHLIAFCLQFFSFLLLYFHFLFITSINGTIFKLEGMDVWIERA